GGGLHLLGRALRVVARDRAVDDAAARVLRSADRALACVAGSLLAVRLAPAARDLGAGLRLVGALTSSGQLGDDDLVDERDVRGNGEHGCGKLRGAGLRAVRVDDVDGQRVGHLLCLLRGGADQDDSTLGSGDGALDEQQAGLGVDGVDREVLRGVLDGTHAAGHLHALEDATRGRGPADRAGLAVVAVLTVGRTDTGEVVALHDTSGALALAGRGNVAR